MMSLILLDFKSSSFYSRLLILIKKKKSKYSFTIDIKT